VLVTWANGARCPWQCDGHGWQGLCGKSAGHADMPLRGQEVGAWPSMSSPVHGRTLVVQHCVQEGIGAWNQGGSRRPDPVSQGGRRRGKRSMARRWLGLDAGLQGGAGAPSGRLCSRAPSARQGKALAVYVSVRVCPGAEWLRGQADVEGRDRVGAWRGRGRGRGAEQRQTRGGGRRTAKGATRPAASLRSEGLWHEGRAQHE